MTAELVQNCDLRSVRLFSFVSKVGRSFGFKFEASNGRFKLVKLDG